MTSGQGKEKWKCGVQGKAGLQAEAAIEEEE
jgi:hypothetical protein